MDSDEESEKQECSCGSEPDVVLTFEGDEECHFCGKRKERLFCISATACSGDAVVTMICEQCMGEAFSNYKSCFPRSSQKAYDVYLGR